MFKAGDLVRHRMKAEWGLGRVSGQTTDGKVLLKFADRAGDVLLTSAGATSHLVLDPDAQWIEVKRTRARKVAVRRTPCATCATDLRTAVVFADGTWKACPECSAKNGRQHLLHPFPEAFGESAPSGTDDATAGWCLTCRAGSAETSSRLCSDFPR